MSTLARTAFMLLLSLPIAGHAQKKLLCLQDQVSVFYNVFKIGEEGDKDKWQVDLEIQNEARYALYYKTRHTLMSAIMEEENPINQLTGKKAPPKLTNPLLGPYLKVKVLNEAGVDNYPPSRYIHGAITLIITTDSTAILKIDESRHVKSFEVMLTKDSYPIVEGEFVEQLLSLQDAKKKRLKKPD